MAMEQTLWFFRSEGMEAGQAIQIVKALERDRAAPETLPALPVDDIVAALKKRFRGLKVDRENALAEVDLPKLETYVTVRWSSRAFECVFEGAGFEAMERAAKVLAGFGCGTCYGKDYFPPEEPFPGPADPEEDARLEAFGQVTDRIIDQVWAQHPKDARARMAEQTRLLNSPEVRREIEDLTAKILAKKRK